MYAKNEKIHPAYVSKQHKMWKKSYSFNDSERRKLKLSCSKKISPLFRGIISIRHGHFYCLNCLHSFAANSKLESHIKVYEYKDFSNITKSSKDTKILEFN